MNSMSNLFKASLLVAGAMVTAGTSLGVAAAADEAAATPPPPGPGGWHGRGHHGDPWHLLRKLDLTTAQQAQIKDIFTAARSQIKSLHQQMHANQLKLQETSPTAANYASIASEVSQTHGSLAAQLVTEESEVRAQVFKVLTAPQQTKLTTLEAQMRARWASHQQGPPPDAE